MNSCLTGNDTADNLELACPEQPRCRHSQLSSEHVRKATYRAAIWNNRYRRRSRHRGVSAERSCAQASVAGVTSAVSRSDLRVDGAGPGDGVRDSAGEG